MSATATPTIDRQAREKRQAPGPRGSLIMGNLAAYKQDPITMLLQLQQQYGDVVHNRLGPFNTHALAHPDHVQHVLVDNHRNYVRGRFYDNFKLFFGDGLLTTDGEFWRRHRRAVQPLFNRKFVDGCGDVVAQAAQGLVERWRLLPAGETVDVVPEMMHLSLNMLGCMVFNTDISQHAEQVGPAVRFGLEAMMPQGDMNDFIPRWAPTPFNFKVRRARKGIDRIIQQIIHDHRDGHAETSDIISMLLAARHPETGLPMTEIEVHDEVMTTFLAGHETTGSGLAWALYALAQNPAALRNLRDELDQQCAGQVPPAAQLEQLPYLNQFVQEVLRVYPPIWGYTRDLVDDDEIGGFHIPGGSSVFISPYVTHRHPDFWRNPEAFDPENFGTDAPKQPTFAYFPFGGGMRKCIGFQMALLQMRILVAAIAQHFDLSALPGHPIVRGALISLRPIKGIRLTIRPRAAQRLVQELRTTIMQNDSDDSDDADYDAASDSSPSSDLSGGQQHVDAESVVASEVRSNAAMSGCPFAAKAVSISDMVAVTATAVSTRSIHASDSAADAPATAISAPQKAGATTTLAVAHTPHFGQMQQTQLQQAQATAGASTSNPAHRFVWALSEIAPLPPTPAAGLAGKHILIVNGQAHTAERIAAALGRVCASAVVFFPDSATDIAAQASALVRNQGPFDGIIDLGLEEAYRLDCRATWEAPMRNSVALLQANYVAWTQEYDPSRLFYMAVTWMGGQMGYGDAHLSQPLGGLWSGLAKTLPQEIPNCNVRILDVALDQADVIDKILIAELYRGGLFEVGYHEGHRYTLVAERADLLPTKLSKALDAVDVVPHHRLEAGDVVLLSGGARGIGLLCAQAIAKDTGATVIVTGRDPLPDGNEVWATMSDVDFKRYSQDQMRTATVQQPLVRIRAELSRIQRRRDLAASLALRKRRFNQYFQEQNTASRLKAAVHSKALPS